MKVIGCLGRKGGSGKTMVSHLLAHGLSKGYGIFTNLVMTDVREGQPINFTSKREYYISSIANKNPEQDSLELGKIARFTDQVPNSVLIIDGGANRANVDAAFSELCDMILIPAGTSVEDLQVAESDYWNLSNVTKTAEAIVDIFVIRNRWPGVGKKREALLQRAWVSQFMQKAERTGMLFPDYIPDMPSLLDMANADDPKTTPLIDAVSTRFAEIIALKIGMDLPPKRKLIPYGLGQTRGQEEPSRTETPETTPQSPELKSEAPSITKPLYGVHATNIDGDNRPLRKA